MSSKTKIVVLHRKEVVYTIVFLVLAIILAILLYVMFGHSHSDSAATTASDGIYQPGIYASSISLSDNTFDVAVTVDSDRIKSIALVNLSESTSAMYPLMEPALEDLASQIYATQSTDNIAYDESTQYTSTLLLSAIDHALAKAKSE